MFSKSQMFAPPMATALEATTLDASTLGVERQLSDTTLGVERESSDASTIDDFHLPSTETCVVGVWAAKLKGEDFAGQAIVGIGGERVQLLWVADGHGGAEAAEYCHR